MQIDFHQGQTQVTHRRGEGKPFVMPVMIKRVIGLLVAVAGLFLIAISILALIVSRSNSPYALLFFEQKDPAKPQASAHIIWINEAKNSVQVTDVPDSLEFHSQSLGTYPIASIYAAHKTTKQSQSDFLTDVSFYFRFPIKSYVYSAKPVAVTKLSLLRFVINGCFFSIDHSLHFGECVHLLAFLSSLSTTIRDQPFPQTALGAERVTSMQPLDRTKYREWSQAHFAESFKIWRKYTVAVLNGTSTSGLATSASSILQDFGLSVLSIGETRTPQENGEIVLNTTVSKEPALVEFLQTTMRLPSRIDDAVTTQYRSDVVVFIGEKEAKFFSP